METTTGIENYEKNLTDLECAIIEAQAFDRYKRYLKAAKEVDKAYKKFEDERDLNAETEIEDSDKIWYEFQNNTIFGIHDKYDIPRIDAFFGEDVWCCGCNVLMFHNLSFQNFKQWITAAAYGRLSEYQYRYLVDGCEAFDYMDPYWVMLGVPMYWTGDMQPDPTEELGGYNVVEKMMHSLCTRNKSKARRLPDFGYTYKGQTGFVLNEMEPDKEAAIRFTKFLELNLGITKQ